MAGIAQRKLRALFGACALALLAAGLVAHAAGAVRLGWKETAKDGKTSVLVFHVESFTATPTGWSARVSFGNLSHHTIKVGNQFGVALFASATSTDLSKSLGVAPATTFSPARPSELKPGATWSGVMRGSDDIVTTRLLHARLVFGPLTGVPGQRTPIYWITDHSTLVGPPPSGPVI